MPQSIGFQENDGTLFKYKTKIDVRMEKMRNRDFLSSSFSSPKTL